MTLLPFLLLITACFRTAAEAATQTGVRDGEGFRLEGIKADRLGGAHWATVRWCAHPERPGILIKTPDQATQTEPQSHAPGPVRPPLVFAGATVSVLLTSPNSRLALPGIAQANGAAGDHVRVRLTTTSEYAEPRFLEAIVRTEGVLEVEAAQ